MVDFSKLPIAKLFAIVFAGLAIFLLFNAQVHYSVIEKVEDCELLLDPNQVTDCKKEIDDCLKLPKPEQQRACFATATVNSGLILDWSTRLLLFLVFVLGVVFWEPFWRLLKREEDIERDVPKEPDALLKKKIIEQLGCGRPDRNWMKNVKIDLRILQRNRAGIAFFSGTGIRRVDGTMCIIDPRKGVREPVMSELGTPYYFGSHYGKDTPQGRLLADVTEIVGKSLPVREPKKEAEKERVVFPQEQVVSGAGAREVI